MSVTSGFYNSLNGDRTYTADQMSDIFEGVINDGVFKNIGTAFKVEAGSGNNVTVGVGKAWFNNKWVFNDSVLTVTTESSDSLLDRYDAVVIEINKNDDVRNGFIKVITGTASSSASRPELTSSDFVNQYPLCYIYRPAGSSGITQENIENTIGTDSCPYVKTINDEFAAELDSRVSNIENGTTLVGKASEATKATRDGVGQTIHTTYATNDYLMQKIIENMTHIVVAKSGEETISAGSPYTTGYLYFVYDE